MGIRRITLEQARKLRGMTNWKKVREMTEDELNKNIADDPDTCKLTDEELAEFQLASLRRPSKNEQK